MAATEEDIQRLTNDGVVVTVEDAAILTLIQDALPVKGSEADEIEMFFDEPDDASAMLEERFAFLSQVAAAHEGIEFSQAIDLGGALSLSPVVPSFTLIDEARGLNIQARVRAFVDEGATDRFSIEFAQ